MRSPRWFSPWLVPLLLVLSVGTVWLRLLIVRTTYEINQTEMEIRASRQDREKLELEVASLRSPRRLARIAQERFGLTRPDSRKIIHLQIDGEAAVEADSR